MVTPGVPLNRINPKKLLNSKWTAVTPINREKHFLVTEVEFDEEDVVKTCVVEAVISRRCEAIEWTDLQETGKWIQGWK